MDIIFVIVILVIMGVSIITACIYYNTKCGRQGKCCHGSKKERSAHHQNNSTSGQKMSLLLDEPKI